MIYLTGDTHGDPRRLNTKDFPEGKDLIKTDTVIILGDFGLIWDRTPSNTELYWYKWLSEKPWLTLFLDGNHENFDRIDNLEEIGLFGGKVGRLNNSIFHLKRGEVYNIDGNKFFVFGGGYSIDKAQRVTGISWWDREFPNHAEYKNGLDNLERCNFDVDYILTHDCPASIYEPMQQKYDIRKMANYDLPKFLEEVKNKSQFKHWYFGHFHLNEAFGESFSCLYKDVILLGTRRQRERNDKMA